VVKLPRSNPQGKRNAIRNPTLHKTLMHQNAAKKNQLEGDFKKGAVEGRRGTVGSPSWVLRNNYEKKLKSKGTKWQGPDTAQKNNDKPKKKSMKKETEPRKFLRASFQESDG